MLSKIEIMLAVAIALSAVSPASAATKHHRVTHVRSAIYNDTVGNIHSRGPDNKGEGDIFGRPRGPANRDGEI
jgi:hypothetical protein